MFGASIDRRIYQIHAELCKTLANPTRLELLTLLRDGEKSVSELLSLTGKGQANLSQHLKVLRERGVVVTRKQGASVYYAIANPKITRACEIIREVLFEQLAEGQALVKGTKEDEKR